VSGETRTSSQPQARLLWIVVAFAIVTLSVASAGLWYYTSQRAALRERVFNEMETVSTLKAQATADLVAHNESFLVRSSQSPYFLAAAYALIDSDTPAARAVMRERLALELNGSGFTEVALIDEDGAVIEFASTEGTFAVSAKDLELLGPASVGQVDRTDLYLGPDGKPTLDFMAPLVDGQTNDPRPAAYLLARVDPYGDIYPELLSWPVPSRTGETLLVKQDGDKVLYLNELRHEAGTALTLRLPLDESLPAARAVSGDQRPLEGLDYRGVEVIADGEPVEGTEWHVVSKIDAEEVYAPLRNTGALTLLAVLAAILAAGAGATWLWARQTRESFQRLYEAQLERARVEQELEQSEERLRLALDATSDALWDLDVASGTAVVNPRYYTMLGFDEGAWPSTLGFWKTLIHPDDLEAAEAAITSMISGGAPGAVAEMRLKTRDGAWKWVLSRSKVVARDKDGTASRIVGTHIDLTDSKERELELDRYRRHLEDLVEERSGEVKAANERLQEANEELSGMNEELTALNEELSANNEELDQTNEELASVNEEMLASNEELAAVNEELGEANDRIESVNAELATASRVKNDFLANMSHELRTPLNSILGFTGVLLQDIAGPLNDEQRKQLGMVKHSGEHLLALVNDILDLERIESGTVVLEPVSLDPREVLESLTNRMLPLAEDRKLALSCDLANAPIAVQADARSLEQILFNLIGNAIKYTEQGSVTVQVTCENNEVRFAVHDTGIGIPRENHATIFDEFVQVRARSGEKPGGTGLGLAVSRRLAEMHGGRIELTSSTLGVGSVFTLVLPTASCE